MDIDIETFCDIQSIISGFFSEYGMIMPVIKLPRKRKPLEQGDIDYMLAWMIQDYLKGGPE